MTNTSFDRTVGDAFTRLCWKVGTPFAYKALLLFKRQDWGGLIAIKVAIGSYTCAKTLYGDLQVAAFLKKYPGFDLGRDLEAEARESFYVSERLCFQTNERLSPLLFDSGHYGELHQRVLREWRKEIKSVLGRAPRLDQLRCSFGPGSTYLNVGDDITVAHKLSDGYTLTRQASFVLSDWDLTAWSRYAACNLVPDFPDEGEPVAEIGGKMLYQPTASYAVRDCQYVRGNRFTTVPKDAAKLRGICIEPSVNVYYQLGVGNAISRKLRRWGWDKETAQDYHKSLARIGSLTGAVATVDLSSASDTICSNLVKLLLPHDWYRLVDGLRSSFTRIDGRWVKLEKFSSMGNGFTFELETLIFWALARAVQRITLPTEDPFTPGVTTSVYGDDIVIPSSVAHSYLAALRFFGFTPNATKTFTKGPFRESCGGDFFNGQDVRPHYVKEVPDAPEKLIALANGIRRFNIRMRILGGGDIGRSVWFSVLDAIPRPIRTCRGPEALGDLVIHDDESVWTQTNSRVRGSVRYLRVWKPVPNRPVGWDQFRPGVVNAAALYGVPSGTSPVPGLPEIERFRRSGVIPRIRGSYVSGYRFGRVAYS